MRKSLLIARSNMRRARGQAVAIVVLILIAAMMLNLWLMLALDYKANFDRYHDKLNDGHVTLVVDSDTPEFRAFLTETLEQDSRADQFRLDSCMDMVATFAYNGGEINTEMIFLDKDAALSRSIGTVELVGEGSYSSGVYLPMLYKTDEIAVGRPVEISIGSTQVIYTVCGFFNSTMMGSHNCTMMEIILTDDKYQELEALGYAPRAVLCSMRLFDKSESRVVEADLKTAVSGQFPGARAVSNSYAMVTQSRYISQMICSGIISAMAFFVLLIALIVIASNIINYIQVNIKDLGALKAVGYTSRQLVGSLLVQFLGLSLLAAVAGAGLSYALFPGLNSMMIGQTGIPYAIRFLPLPFALTLAILGAAVALAVWLAARRIKQIEPITALRAGLSTHNFKRNHVPLDKTKVPLDFALALKTTLSGVKHNVTVCVTM
ncbi:MAG: ABC transporter permease, partial [Oscillospiraceae bacterium]|nr:ABC transporter permease [Oscillospiraceae bacterium]